MKRACVFVAALLVAACSPEIYPLHLEVRQPSPSGLDLNRKSMSIVYMDGSNNLDSLFDRSVASALARHLEEDYFNGQEVVELYHISSADSVTVETMRSLVMDTEKDVVFLMSTHLGELNPEENQPVSGAVASSDSAFVCPVALPVSTSVQIYDSMGQDKVARFSGSAVLHPMVYNSGVTTQDGLKTLALMQLDSQAEEVARRISTRFVSDWKTESFSFYYFDDFRVDEWVEALQHVNDGQFAKAIDVWMPLVSKGYTIKRACAAYNLAMAFYLLEDYELSERWLSLAEKMENLSLAPGLRKRLGAHLEKTQ